MLACPYCDRAFSSTRGIFGQDATLLRDAHIPLCEDNPRNRCFCGAIFPNAIAREKHAAMCEKNPANLFKCPHCPQEFLTTFGIMGRIATDGKVLRDNHAVCCKDNPANTCFCGNLFPNPEARNLHAVVCDKNPANNYDCQFCNAHFVKTFNMFGFCKNDGLAERDTHQLGCEKNPKNVCFCGGVFPNAAAKDKHAATCSSNPVNRFECCHCKRLFITRFGVMSRVSYDGKGQRDAHEVGCEKSPANVCYCGQLFLNPGARDAHAVKCEMNPANRFNCQYCRTTFVTSFGIFSSNGETERDAHMLICMRNPANSTCDYCNRTFTDAKGPLQWFHAGAHKRCEKHVLACKKNPRNRFNCDSCGKCFIGGQGWLRRKDGKSELDRHHKVCDYIPCTYQLRETDFSDWLLMASELDGADNTIGESCAECLADDMDSSQTHSLSSEALGSAEGILSAARSNDQLDLYDTASSCSCELESLDGTLPEEVQSETDLGHACDAPVVSEGRPLAAVSNCEPDMDYASVCFQDAHSSDGDSDSGEASSIEHVEVTDYICDASSDVDATNQEAIHSIAEQDTEADGSDHISQCGDRSPTLEAFKDKYPSSLARRILGNVTERW